MIFLDMSSSTIEEKSSIIPSEEKLIGLSGIVFVISNSDGIKVTVDDDCFLHPTMVEIPEP